MASLKFCLTAISPFNLLLAYLELSAFSIPNADKWMSLSILCLWQRSEIILGNFSWILSKLLGPFSNKIPIKFIHTSAFLINSSILLMSNMFDSTISRYPGFACVFNI